MRVMAMSRASTQAAFLRCYLASSRSPIAPVVLAILRDLDVDVDWAQERQAHRGSSPGALRQMLQAVDFVCAVLIGTSKDSTPLYEVGIATGLGKPVFLITDDLSGLPASVTDFPAFIGTPFEEDALRFHLAPFLANLKRLQSTLYGSEAKRGVRPTEVQRGQSTAQLLHTARASREQQLETRVAGLFKEIGADEVILSPRIEDTSLRPDISVWFSGAPVDLGQQFLVEVKSSGARSALESATIQMKHYLLAARLRTGLVVTEASHTLDVVGEVSVLVYRLGIPELQRFVGDDGLLREMLSLRNRFVHGLL